MSKKFKKVIYSNFDDSKSIIINKLCKFDFMPLLIISEKNTQINLSNKTHFLDRTNLRLGKLKQFKFEKNFPLDETILGKFSDYHLNAMGLLEDSSGHNFSFYERKNHYFELLKFWNNYINNYKPEIYISYVTPHTIDCFTLYLICKFIYKIPVIFLDSVPYFNSNYFIACTSIENIYRTFYYRYEILSKKKIKFKKDAVIDKYLHDLRKKSPNMPVHIYTTLSNKQSILKNLIKTIKILFFTLIFGTGFKKSNTFWKKNKKHISNNKSNFNIFEFELFKLIRSIKLKQLQKFYINNCKYQENLKCKFVYFAASYQPESITSPNAKYYDDLLLALEMLASCIDDNTLIYYKEPIYTFTDPLSKSLNRRNIRFYKNILSLKKVRFVHSNVDTYKLIDRSLFVATVSGTASWEAVVRNKPAITFGSNWYSACRSVFHIKNINDLRDAIKRINKGYIPNQLDIYNYLISIKENSIQFPRRNFEDIKNITDNSLKTIEKLAFYIFQTYKRNYE